jgi:hypothetical protein
MDAFLLSSRSPRCVRVSMLEDAIVRNGNFEMTVGPIVAGRIAPSQVEIV